MPTSNDTHYFYLISICNIITKYNKHHKKSCGLYIKLKMKSFLFVLTYFSMAFHRNTKDKVTICFYHYFLFYLTA